ncbi:MAG: hypothetical protein PHT07_17745 [Paludibacter sp.]|nr:hypothetical protein [Paludibacter sp.]
MKTAYNPIMYYKLTTTGFQLDSTLTIERNKVIYGEFYGYKYNAKIEMPISVLKELDKEKNRIVTGK